MSRKHWIDTWIKTVFACQHRPETETPGGEPGERWRFPMYSNNTTSISKNEPQDIAVDLSTTAFVSGVGQYHTANPGANNPAPYAHVTFNDIIRMAGAPKAVPKDRAPWVIFSTTGGEQARVHQIQREKGQFGGLWADLDKVDGTTFDYIVRQIGDVLRGCRYIVYTSSSATERNPKSRLIIPLTNLIPGGDYTMLARILNNRLKKVNLIPDRATERPGQLCYLPNRGQYYQRRVNEGPLLDPYKAFIKEIRAEQDRLRKEQEERERRHQEAIQKTQERINTGQANPVEAFKQTYPVDLALERYGYVAAGNKYLSPLSESGKPGVTILDNGKWYSHHGSDAGIGKHDKEGGTWGDAFDLFVYYEHDGDFNKAVQAAGRMFTTTDPETGQVISLTRLNQREYMRQRGAAGDAFQGKDADQAEQIWEALVPLDDTHPPAMVPDILTGLVGDRPVGIGGCLPG